MQLLSAGPFADNVVSVKPEVGDCDALLKQRDPVRTGGSGEQHLVCEIQRGRWRPRCGLVAEIANFQSLLLRWVLRV